MRASTQLRLCLLAGATVLAPSVARAQGTQITSSSSSLLAGATTINFDTITAATANSFTLSGVTFTAEIGKTITIDSSYAGQFNTTGQSLQNTYLSTAFGQLTITFASFLVSAFGFNYGASDALWTLSAYDANSNLLGTQTLPILNGSNNGEFYGLGGFATPIASVTVVGPNSDFIFIDNFKLVAVPEPTTCAIALGLCALALAASSRPRAARSSATHRA